MRWALRMDPAVTVVLVALEVFCAHANASVPAPTVVTDALRNNGSRLAVPLVPALSVTPNALVADRTLANPTIPSRMSIQNPVAPPGALMVNLMARLLVVLFGSVWDGLMAARGTVHAFISAALKTSPTFQDLTGTHYSAQ